MRRECGGIYTFQKMLPYFLLCLLVTFLVLLHACKLKITGGKVATTQERLASFKVVFIFIMKPKTTAGLRTGVGKCLDSEKSGCKG